MNRLLTLFVSVTIALLAMQGVATAHTACDVSGDTYVGDEHNNDCTGTSADEFFLGLAGDDTLAGAGGGDSLEGGENADLLRGQAGPDIIRGNGGQDDALLGSGNDVFLSGSGDGTANDEVCDGTGEDDINVSDGDGGDIVYLENDGEPDSTTTDAGDTVNQHTACPL